MLYIYIPDIFNRAVGRSENPGVPVLFGEHNLPPMVEIGLIDLRKYRGYHGTLRIPRDNMPVRIKLKVVSKVLSNIKAFP